MTKAINEQKRALRQKFLARRRALAAEQRQQKSAALLALFCSQPFYEKAQSVMAYASMADEVQTRPLLEKILKDKKRLYIPYIVDLPKGHMEAVRVYSLDELEKGACGILTAPKENIEAVSQSLDIIITSGVAFTKRLERLGMGAGFYDRFLTRHKAALKVGFFFEVQKAAALPAEEHDLKLDLILTEEKIYQANRSARAY